MAKDYPDFVESCGYGQLLGIGGVNCRHTFSAYYPDIQTEDTDDVNPEENKRYYELTQQQRAKERNIRELKRRISAIESANINDDETNKKLDNYKSSLRQKNVEYRDFCKENNLSTTNWRKQI